MSNWHRVIVCWEFEGPPRESADDDIQRLVDERIRAIGAAGEMYVQSVAYSCGVGEPGVDIERHPFTCETTVAYNSNGMLLEDLCDSLSEMSWMSPHTVQVFFKGEYDSTYSVRTMRPDRTWSETQRTG